MSFTHQTDLFLQHQFALKATTLAFSVNVLNLFDQDEQIDYDPFELFRGQAVVIGRDEFFRGFDGSQLIATQELARNPRFLQPGAPYPVDNANFQAPRTIRVGLRVRF